MARPTGHALWGIGVGGYAGLNNRVVIGREDGSSLYLIEVERLRLLVGRKARSILTPKKARRQFIYQDSTYRMDITDPTIERKYLGQADGQYDIANLSCA